MVKVPAGVKNNALLKVKGKGAPDMKGGPAGDFYVRVEIDFPKKPNKKEKELLDKYNKMISGN